ncbi:MAG TPA: DUF1559 domain-containing protein, partial [Candidatus Methylomirabilis sp.]|nr:DUF1559 domain-containing protein [Candidatus Methylomirabilis sp.]
TVLVLVMLMALPRGREQARLTACQKNLAQIGLALALYDQTQRQLPTIDRPERIDDTGLESGPGPLKILLQTLRQADFLGLAPNATPPHPTGPVPGEVLVPGFICSSDPNATAGLFQAPISYRGNTGGDHLGRNGVFAPGRRISLAEIEQEDGSSYTAAFSERLVGDSLDGHLSPWNYAAAGPLPAQGCSLVWLKGQVAQWRGDAGSSWVVAGNRSPSTTTPCNRDLHYPAWPWTDNRPTWGPRAATAGESICSCSTARSSSSCPRSTPRCGGTSPPLPILHRARKTRERGPLSWGGCNPQRSDNGLLGCAHHAECSGHANSSAHV